MKVAMTKNLGYILAAVFMALIWGILWRAKTNEAAWSNDQRAYADSLAVKDAAINRLTLERNFYQYAAQLHTAKADSIARTNVTTIILNDARKATRNATVDSVGAILDRSPD